MLTIRDYNRDAVVAYAHKWAYGRNPAYYNFENIGGDCTNFASQCIYAGDAVMNYTPVYGWYYNNINSRAPAWSGVNEFYRFITSNQGVGPFARETSISELQIGDVVQLATMHPYYHHTPVIIQINGLPTLENILVAAHSNDADYRPLSSYTINKIRFLHIDGIRVQSV